LTVTLSVTCTTRPFGGTIALGDRLPNASPTRSERMFPLSQAISLPLGDQAQTLGSVTCASGRLVPSAFRRKSESPTA
jgi:hypothetical protein